MLKYLSDHRELEEINMHIKRNEGYQKSLQQDEIAAASSKDLQQQAWLTGEADNWFKRR